MPADLAPKTALSPGPRSWHPHYEAVLNWCLANPHRNDSEGASELGFTHAWFSQIVNSDMFRVRFNERAREMGLGMATAAQSIHAKMLAAANLSIDETIRKLETKTASETFVGSTRDSLLTKLGYTVESTKSEDQREAGGDVHIHVAGKQALQDARTILDRLGATDIEVNGE